MTNFKTNKINDPLTKIIAIQHEAEKIPGYCWTIVDDRIELEWGGGWESYYTGQELPKIPYVIHADDQKEFSNHIKNVWCFVYWNSNNASMNLNLKFNIAERETIAFKWTQTQWYDPKWGWYFVRWAAVVDNVLDNKKVDYIRYKILTSNFTMCMKVLDAWYALTIPINISNELREGLFDDWVLNPDEIVWVTSFGHLMNIKKHESGDYVLWIDNYPESNSQNIFTIEDVQFLFKSWVLMNVARFYAPTKDLIEEPTTWSQWDSYAVTCSDFAIQELGIKRERMNDPITRFETISIAWRILKWIIKRYK